MAEQKNQLIRGLTLTDTTALVVGTVIGTGVFLKAAVMSQEVGTPTLVLLAWVAAGRVGPGVRRCGRRRWVRIGVRRAEAGARLCATRRYGLGPAGGAARRCSWRRRPVPVGVERVGAGVRRCRWVSVGVGRVGAGVRRCRWVPVGVGRVGAGVRRCG